MKQETIRNNKTQ